MNILYKPDNIIAHGECLPSNRKSGVELIKVIAIFLIVISHVTQTLYNSANVNIGISDYQVPLGSSTTNVQTIIMMLLAQTGALGNNVFFICSAWFLVGKVGNARKKAFTLLCTVWVISVIFLAIYSFANPACLSAKVVKKQLLPTCYANNWYMSCYIVFLFIFPWLNRIIEIVSQRQLLRIVLFSSFIWICIDYIRDGAFFPSFLILWITVYFLISYLKKYCSAAMRSAKVGACMLMIGIAGYVLQVVATNYAGLYMFSGLSGSVLRWNHNCSPFYILLALGALSLSLQAKFKSRIINYLSSLSMFVYLVHENYLFKVYTRPYIWHHLYVIYGYSHLVMLDLIFAAILFLISVVICAIYKETVQKLVLRISSSLYVFFSGLYLRLEHRIIHG